jgi:nicotinate-nucleotide adenylyltransferase
MIGVCGGTFDPVHLGHVQPALDLLEALPLREIRFVPVRTPPHRDSPRASAEHRWRMLKLALKAHAGLVADARELRREGPSYTIDTLRELRAELRETLCLIMGNDAFSGFTSWCCWEEILQLAHIVVTTRPGTQLPTHGAVARLLSERRYDAPGDLMRQSSGGVLPCPVRPVDISATTLRAKLEAGGDASAMLPTPVWRYIRSHGLYSVAHAEPKLSKGDDGN